MPTDATYTCMSVSVKLCKFWNSCQDPSNVYLKVVNSRQFIQSDFDTRSWHQGMAASVECLHLLCALSCHQTTLGSPAHPRPYSASSHSHSNRQAACRLPFVMLRLKYWYSHVKGCLVFGSSSPTLSLQLPKTIGAMIPLPTHSQY